MINVRYQGEKRFIDITLPGGTLSVVETTAPVQDEWLDAAGAVVTHREFEYHGIIPRDVGLSMVRAYESDYPATIQVNGKTVSEFLEGL